MRRLAALVLLLTLGLTAHAQVYRWVDEGGRVHYADAPPLGTAKPVSVLGSNAGGGIATSQSLPAGEEPTSKPIAPGSLPADAPAARGLDFRTYLSIRPGMSEGELLALTGEPDLLVDQGVERSRATRTELIIRTYTYLPTPVDPYTTTVKLVGGKVTGVDRARKS